MKKLKKKILCSLLLQGLFSVFSLHASSVYVTVWIHGTHPIKPILTSRYSPLRARMYAEDGLSLASKLPQNYGFAKIAQACAAYNPTEYDINHFYIYGWNSGNVRPSHRKKIGKKLYDDLSNLLVRYKEQYDTVKLRLIGFSHGGNVVLNCVHCLPFTIKNIETEVVLVATPIQEETRLYINNPFIARAYSFYSDSDWIQTCDMQKFHKTAPKHAPWFSQRTFKDTDNVIQVHLKVNNNGIGHLRFHSVLGHLSKIMEQVIDRLQSSMDMKCMLLNFLC